MAERVLVLSISVLVEEGRFHGLEDVLRSYVVEPSQRAKKGVTPRRLRLDRSGRGKLRLSLLEQLPAPLTPERNNARADKEGGTSIHPLRSTPILVAGRQTYG
jgi:hypothetical protein